MEWGGPAVDRPSVELARASRATPTKAARRPAAAAPKRRGERAPVAKLDHELSAPATASILAAPQSPRRPPRPAPSSPPSRDGAARAPPPPRRPLASPPLARASGAPPSSSSELSAARTCEWRPRVGGQRARRARRSLAEEAAARRVETRRCREAHRLVGLRGEGEQRTAPPPRPHESAPPAVALAMASRSSSSSPSNRRAERRVAPVSIKGEAAGRRRAGVAPRPRAGALARTAVARVRRDAPSPPLPRVALNGQPADVRQAGDGAPARRGHVRTARTSGPTSAKTTSRVWRVAAFGRALPLSCRRAHPPARCRRACRRRAARAHVRPPGRRARGRWCARAPRRPSRRGTRADESDVTHPPAAPQAAEPRAAGRARRRPTAPGRTRRR